MKFTCFITVCACLSSTVFTNEVKYLNNRVKKIARSPEELIIKDAATRREINPIPQIYSDIYPTSRQFQSRESKKNHEVQSGPQQQQQSSQPQQSPQSQQQQHRYNRGRSRHSAKHVKTRSIGGLPTYEVSDNQIDSIPEVIYDEEPIRIEPMIRVTRKKNVFDSIIDIVHQLLDPPKNELGPLVPIQMPGSKRKIYLRLIEPVDASEVMVRFVTQLPVPVIDAEKQYNPFIPIPSIVDPITMLMNQAHHGIHPVLHGDPLFASSSNRHRAIYPPRNVSHVKGVQPPKSQNSQNPSKDPQIKGSFPPAIDSNKEESNKNHFTNTRVNLQNQEQQLLSESAASYYQYQAAGEEVMNKVKELLEKENVTTTVKTEADPSVQPWHQLSTHRLPLRQIAPYSPASMEQDSSSHTDTYKAPSDVFTGPSSYSTSYEQYNDAANSAPEFYPSSYSGPSSYSTPYKQNEIHDAHPNTYSTSYHKQNEFNNAPSSYSVSYQDQNEFNGAPSSYSTSYQSQEYSAPDSYATSYGKQNDLFSAPSAYSSSYEKPTPPSSFYDKQTGITETSANSNALEIVDPPSYLPGYRTENQASRGFGTISTRQPRYNNPREMAGLNTEESASRVIWGKSKQEKDESSFQKSAEITGTGIDDSREKWQPVVFVHENAGWHEAYEAEMMKTATTERQAVPKARPTKKPSRGATDQARRNVKQRGSVSARDSRFSTVSGEQNGCEQKKSTTTSTTTPRSESTIRIIEKQTQSVGSELILVTQSPNITIETLRPNLTAKSPMVSTTMMTLTTVTSKPLVTTTKSPESMSVKNEMTERSKPLLIKVLKSTTTEKPLLLIKAIENIFMSNIEEKLIATEASVIKPTVSNVMKKVRSTTEKSSSTIEKTLMKVTTKVSNNKVKKAEIPKRPMIMKKSTYIMKRPALSSTTERTVTTQKPTISSTTKKTTLAGKSKFFRTISKRRPTTT
ncbi:uncharacterized protein LOC112639448 [Camponotus floridanus]|nr:uncharacterized protein LOC112639448 [Camponotus floridanus]